MERERPVAETGGLNICPWVERQPVAAFVLHRHGAKMLRECTEGFKVGTETAEQQRTMRLEQAADLALVDVRKPLAWMRFDKDVRSTILGDRHQ